MHLVTKDRYHSQLKQYLWFETSLILFRISDKEKER